jgi:ABC-2 type transport system ATP-binding protein
MPLSPFEERGPAAIQTTDLRKAFGRKVAVEGLTLTVRPGEVFGFLGPNGAGKTSTIKMLLGLVKPTSGEALVLGGSPSDPATRRRVGYLPENFRFHDWLTGEQLLDFHGQLARLTARERKERIPVVLRQVGLEGRGGDRVHNYSKGMTQRIGLAQAIMHRPEVVLLDEPTSALDPIGRREVRDIIRTLRSEGIAVFLNSHLLSEVELVCDRVAIVDQGRVVREGRLDALVGHATELRLTLDRVDADLRDILARFGEVLAVSDLAVTMGVSDPEVAPRVAEAVIRSGYRLYGLVPMHRSLEDVFISLVERGEG